MKSGDFFNPRGMMYGAVVPDWLKAMRGVSPGAKLCYAEMIYQINSPGGREWVDRLAVIEACAIGPGQGIKYINELSKQKLLSVRRIGWGPVEIAPYFEESEQ